MNICEYYKIHIISHVVCIINDICCIGLWGSWGEAFGVLESFACSANIKHANDNLEDKACVLTIPNGNPAHISRIYIVCI